MLSRWKIYDFWVVWANDWTSTRPRSKTGSITLSDQAEIDGRSRRPNRDWRSEFRECLFFFPKVLFLKSEKLKFLASSSSRALHPPCYLCNLITILVLIASIIASRYDHRDLILISFFSSRPQSRENGNICGHDAKEWSERWRRRERFRCYGRL